MSAPRTPGRIAAAIALALVPSLAAAQAPTPPGGGRGRTPVAPAADVEVVQVTPDVYMIGGAGANIAVQIGDEGTLVVDTGDPAATGKVMAEINKLAVRPVRWIINTNGDLEHTGGNGPIAKAGVGAPPGGGGCGALVLKPSACSSPRVAAGDSECDTRRAAMACTQLSESATPLSSTGTASSPRRRPMCRSRREA